MHTREMLQSIWNLFLVTLVMSLKEYNLVIIQLISKFRSRMCIDCKRMNSCPSRFWSRGLRVRAEKQWCFPPSCILRSELDRHNEIKLKIKFHLLMRDYGKQKCQNIVLRRDIFFFLWRAEFVVCHLKVTGSFLIAIQVGVVCSVYYYPFT